MTRIFFSYSHDSDAHKLWVRNRAHDLSRRGLEVILDQNDLKPGGDIHHFVELAVTSADFVLMVCTPQYAARANSRQRGVGMETALITSEIYRGATDKFIALLRQGGVDESIPSYLMHKLYVDLRDDGKRDEWERLCQHLLENGPASQIGTLIFEALFPYDKNRIYDQPRLPELKRFTQFVETGRNERGRWYVIRRDPIRRDLATILFQDSEKKS